MEFGSGVELLRSGLRRGLRRRLRCLEQGLEQEFGSGVWLWSGLRRGLRRRFQVLEQELEQELAQVLVVEWAQAWVVELAPGVGFSEAPVIKT